MTLTEEQYDNKLMMLMKLGWDIYKFRTGIQCRTTVPNPYCKKELDDALDKMQALLVQLQTHNVDEYGKSLTDNDRWWFPDILKDSKAEVTQLA
jgi:hypothetical protein